MEESKEKERLCMKESKKSLCGGGQGGRRGEERKSEKINIKGQKEHHENRCHSAPASHLACRPSVPAYLTIERVGTRTVLV